MLRTTIVKNELAWALTVITASLICIPCFGQDETLPDPTANASVFEKLFGKSNIQSTDSKKPKPKVPAIPTAGKPSRSGFLLPLKSFSRTVRGPVESEEWEEIRESSPLIGAQNRIPREPFRSLPRVQERRDRETNDLHFEKLNQGLPPTAARLSPTMPVPIITPESVRSSASTLSKSIPLNSKPSTSRPLQSKQVIAGSSKSPAPEILIESNSTSRRTAMDGESGDKAIANRFLDSSSEGQKSKNTGNDGTKSRPLAKDSTEPKGLIDLGFVAEKPANALVASATREPDSKPYTDSKSQSKRDEIRRTVPPSSAPNRDTIDFSIESKDKTKVVAATTSSDLLREMSAPGIRVTVKGQGSILVDDASKFEIVAKNEGSEALSGLIVRIAVPPHVAISDVAVTDGVALPENDQEGNTIIWELGQILAGNQKVAVVNLKTLKAEHFALEVEWTVLPQSAEMKIEVQQPQLAIALEGPSEVTYGKPQLFRIRVRNTGNADVKNVSVALSAEPYGSNQSDIGSVNAGSERMVEVELTFQQSGVLPIVATAKSDVSKVEARSAIDVQVRQSNLVATWFGPTEFYQGSVIEYELKLNNDGSIAAVGTNCQVKLPPGAEIVSMPSGATRSEDSIQWEVKKIDPNEKLSFPFLLNLSKIGDNQLAFTGTCSSSNDAKADFKTTIDSIADLHLTVLDPAAPAPVGQPVVYEIVISNRGKKSAHDIEVIGQFSDGIEPIRVDGHTGRIVPGQAIFNTIPSIGANEKLVLRIHAQASQPGVHRFRVEVKSKGSDTDLLEEESTRYLATSSKGDRR